MINEVNNSQVNILINKYTKKIANSIVPSDIIQCALEYNNYLIKKLNESRTSLSNEEYDNSLIILWENLKKLSQNCDYFTSNYNLNENRKYTDLYTKYKELYIPSGLTVVIEKSILN